MDKPGTPIEESDPHRMITAWLARYDLRLPPVGMRLTEPMEAALHDLAETEEGKLFTAAWNIDPVLVGAG